MFNSGARSAWSFSLGETFILATSVSMEVKASDSSEVSLDRACSSYLDSISMASLFCLCSSIFVVNI